MLKTILMTCVLTLSGMINLYATESEDSSPKEAIVFTENEDSGDKAPSTEVILGCDEDNDNNVKLLAACKKCRGR